MGLVPAQHTRAVMAAACACSCLCWAFFGWGAAGRRVSDLPRLQVIVFFNIFYFAYIIGSVTLLVVKGDERVGKVIACCHASMQAVGGMPAQQQRGGAFFT